jgi:predicted nuclease with TOPRIM domain
MTFLLVPKLFREGITIEGVICDFILSPPGKRDELEEKVRRIAIEFFDNVRSLEKDPIGHLKKTISLLKDPKASCTLKMGLASNAILALAIPFHIPLLIGVGLAGSTAAHLIHLQEAKQLDILKQMNKELKTMNQQMAENQIRLETEVSHLRESLVTLREENQALTESNQRLRENIRDLEKNITSLQAHGSMLENLNQSFDANLDRLEKGIKLLETQDIEFIDRLSSFDAIHDSVQEMVGLLRQFFTANREHQGAIEHQQHGIHKQLQDLVALSQASKEQIEAIKRFPDLTLMAQQMELALKGICQYQEKLLLAGEELTAMQERALRQKSTLKAKHKRFHDSQIMLLTAHVKKNRTIGRFLDAHKNHVPIDPSSRNEHPGLTF